MSNGRLRKTVPTKRAPVRAAATKAVRARHSLAKAPTGIAGFEEITEGGLPRGRPTLVCGGPGCGKTLLATQFLAQGALEYDELGVFLSFEESTEELAQNSLSIGIDLKQLSARRQLLVDHVHVSRSELTESGEYDRVALLGGSVQVESEPEVGTTITARIPVPPNPRRHVRGRRVDPSA